MKNALLQTYNFPFSKNDNLFVLRYLQAWTSNLGFQEAHYVGNVQHVVQI